MCFVDINLSIMILNTMFLDCLIIFSFILIDKWTLSNKHLGVLSRRLFDGSGFIRQRGRTAFSVWSVALCPSVGALVLLSEGKQQRSMGSIHSTR